MSNANRNMLGTATHYTVRQGFDAPASLCADTACRHATTDRSAVTCKRCLASLAKRDREFQRKARRQFGFPRSRWLTPKHDAEQAIAHEEGQVFDRAGDWTEPFCACGRVVSRCDRSRKGCAAQTLTRGVE